MERAHQEQLVALGTEVVAVRQVAVGGDAGVVAPREGRDDVALDREREIDADHRGERRGPRAGGDQDAFGRHRGVVRRDRPARAVALDRGDAVAQTDLGAELAGAFEQSLRGQHRVGVPRVAFERGDRDPVQVERRPLGHDLLRFEQVGRDALLGQPRHDLAHRRLVLGGMQHQQPGLAEPRVPAGVLLEVAEHRDRVARHARQERVRVVGADDRARPAGRPARGRRPFDHDGADAAAREVERHARAVHAGTDHRDVVGGVSPLAPRVGLGHDVGRGARPLGHDGEAVVLEHDPLDVTDEVLGHDRELRASLRTSWYSAIVISMRRSHDFRAHSHVMVIRRPGGSPWCACSIPSLISLDAASFRAIRSSRELMAGLSPTERGNAVHVAETGRRPPA